MTHRTDGKVHCAVCGEIWEDGHKDHYEYPYPDLAWNKACEQAEFKFSLATSKFIERARETRWKPSETMEVVWKEMIRAHSEYSEIVSNY